MSFRRVVGVLLFAASCKDDGPDRHREALELYTTCVTRMLPPTDPCFTGVLAILDQIPKSSKAHPNADALRTALATAQQPRVRTPLAVQAVGCEQLAQQLGTTPPAERAEKLRALDACRAKAAKDEHDHAEHAH